MLRRSFLNHLTILCNSMQMLTIVKIIVTHDYVQLGLLLWDSFSSCPTARRSWRVSVFPVFGYFAATSDRGCRTLFNTEILAPMPWRSSFYFGMIE
jgi:hypothetical protein